MTSTFNICTLITVAKSQPARENFDCSCNNRVSPLYCIVGGSKKDVLFFTFVGTPEAGWSIRSISNVTTKSIIVEWFHQSANYPFVLGFYAVVCTPTNGDAGPTIKNVYSNENKTIVGRLRPRTNYTVHIVAFIYNNQTDGIILRRSQEASTETFEGGKENV